MFGSCAYSAQTAMSMVEATKAGIGQGELQAGMSTLNSISHMLVSLVSSCLTSPCLALPRLTPRRPLFQPGSPCVTK
jgi:hypothetical protein